MCSHRSTCLADSMVELVAPRRPPSSLRWLVACEFTQRITTELRALGHEAYSCDLEPTEGNPTWHIQRDAIEVAYSFPWDGMIAHTDCTFMTRAGNGWIGHPLYPNRERDRDLAIEFWLKLRAAPIDHTAFENPRPMSYVVDRIGDYDQMVQPFYFGDDFTKATCWWLKNLPPLQATHSVIGIYAKDSIHREPPGPNRKKNRSRTFLGMAKAAATQWGHIPFRTAEGVPTPAEACP